MVEAESEDQVGFLARAVCRPGQLAVGDQEVEGGEVATLLVSGQIGGPELKQSAQVRKGELIGLALGRRAGWRRQPGSQFDLRRLTLNGQHVQWPGVAAARMRPREDGGTSVALWLVRSGRHGEGDELALTSGVVGIGWAPVGDLSGVTTTEQLRERLIASYPEAKATTITNWVAQVDAFQRRIAIGDLVALPLKRTPAIAFGRITGSYRYALQAPESMRHQRSVAWIREDVPRESIAQDILYSLGAFLTVCRIQRNDAEACIEALLDGAAPPTPADPDPDTEQSASDIVRQPDVDLLDLSRDQIRRRIGARFSGHDLARLIGAVLEAEGMYVHVSPAGPDGGVDILAGEGDMGFDGVGLAVQVKSGAIVVDASTLRELQGVMANFGATRGLMVSWGGYTKNARAEARRLFFQLRLWDADDVIARVEAVYERLPQDIQAELALRRIWSLVPDEDA